MLSQNSIEENRIEENSIDIYTTSETKVSSADVAKASAPEKHRYGKYKNVLLKDKELQTLKEDFDNWEQLIGYLDEYIERLGYKAKSHYLCIRKWVVNAVKRENIELQREQKEEQREDRWARFNASDQSGGELNDTTRV